MKIFINLIPVIIISIIAYIFLKDILPAYNQTISLAKEINKLNNQEKDLLEIEKVVDELSRQSNLSALLPYKETLNNWLPREPKIEEILAYLVNSYQVLELGVFPGVSFNISQEERYLISNYVLPVSSVEFRIDLGETNLNKIQEIISFLERKSGRFLKIKKVNLSLTEKGRINGSMEVEGYYIIMNPKGRNE